MVSSKTARTEETSRTDEATRTDKTLRSDKTLALLAALLVLFCLRVSGQLLVAVFHVPFLPPMSEWQSGLLPYPVLVFFQFLIIALYGRICFDFYRQSGFYYVPQRMLAKPLLRVGLVYFVSVAIRLLIWTTMFRHHMWFSGTIPIFFHFVLASFLIVVAKHHCQEFSGLAPSNPSALLKAGITQ